MRRNKCREKRVEKRLTKGGKKRAQAKEEGVRTAWNDVQRKEEESKDIVFCVRKIGSVRE